MELKIWNIIEYNEKHIGRYSYLGVFFSNLRFEDSQSFFGIFLKISDKINVEIHKCKPYVSLRNIQKH